MVAGLSERWFGCFVNNHPIDPWSATFLCFQALVHVAEDQPAKVSAIRVNPIFFWHGLGHFGVVQKNKLNKINRLQQLFYLNFGGLPPAGMASWDGGSLALALGVSDHAVWRVLRKQGVQLQRHRSWCVSTDPEFAAKAADVIGLYLSPPQNALVLSVDEKPSIQALERARGYVQTSSGKIVQGMKSTYKRHGTINLFAALEVATGIIRGKTTQTKKRADFQAFMDEVIADQPPERQIHVILDNLSTHKNNDDWLAAHPNVTFHFTPTSASWLNQVEIWFGIFQRKTLRNASFRSIDQLIESIANFTAAYNENAAPFVWRKREVKGSQLRNTIVNLRN
jgi:transposase